MTLGGDANNNAIWATGSAGQTASVLPGLNAPSLIIAAGKNVSVDPGVTLTVPSVIGGASALTKIGSGTLTLTAANTATGPTVVQAGVLACAIPAALSGGTLSISNSARLELDYVGTRQVASFTLGGALQPNGSYGSSSSPAANKDNAHFVGTGTVTVGPVAPPTPVFPVSGFTMPGGVPTLVVPTQSGYQYRLVYKNALADVSWTPVGTTWTPGTGGNVTMSDPSATGQPQRFYRLEVQ